MSEISELTIDFDAGIYRLTAIKKAAYKFGDCCHVKIETVGERQTKVTLRALSWTET